MKKKHPSILQDQVKIRFVDCDPFNHLNNSRYLDYFINSREDQIEAHYDLNVYLIGKKTGKSWVVGSHQIAYLKPVFLRENVCIESQIIQYSEKNTLVEMRMYNEDKSQIKALLWSDFVYYDLINQKSTTHESMYMNLFEEVLEEVEETEFKSRIRGLLYLEKTRHS